jgi:catechol 2,3-dioxygenase-like lactoylglutathione lyase family enzyme
MRKAPVALVLAAVVGVVVAVAASAAGPPAASGPPASALVDLPRLSPVRRTTIATADPEASLKFWRDLLGFVVEYDQAIDDRDTLSLYLPGARRGRVIALRQGERLGGSIGLFHAPEVAAAGPCRPGQVRAGGASVLLLTDDLAAIRRRLEAAGVPFVAAPVAYSKSRGPTDAFTVFDPNCVRVAFAQIHAEALDESLAR